MVSLCLLVYKGKAAQLALCCRTFILCTMALYMQTNAMLHPMFAGRHSVLAYIQHTAADCEMNNLPAEK